MWIFGDVSGCWCVDDGGVVCFLDCDCGGCCGWLVCVVGDGVGESFGGGLIGV